METPFESAASMKDHVATNDRTMSAMTRRLRGTIAHTLHRLAERITPVRSAPKRRSMLVFDLTHSARSIVASGHQQIVVQRDLGGFFDFVYTFYPMLGADPHDRGNAFRGPRRHVSIAPRHSFIENKAMALSLPAAMAPLNLLLTQAEAILFACRTVQREGISVIRGGDPFVTGLYAYLVAKLTGRPYSLRIGSDFDALAAQGIRSFPTLFPSYDIQRVVGSFVLKHCDLVLVANEKYREYALRNGARPDRTVLVRYGNLVDPIHFTDPACRAGVPPDLPFHDRPFGILVGRLTAVKYPADALLVAARVRERIPDIALVFVGAGDLQDQLEEQAHAMGLENTVYFVGLRNQEWLARIYPHAMAYLSPLTGRSLVEAALAGLPLIAYDCDWHAEIVESGVTGELVAFRDWEAMAEGFARVVVDREYRAKLGANARAVALRMMDQTEIEDIERHAYARLLDLPGSREDANALRRPE